MKILEIKVMRGPNYWSNYRKKLIVMKLDLEMAEQTPTNLIEGFADRIEQCLPSLYEHRCSPGVKGGFFARVRKGTWLGHVVEHVALELQTLAEMQCGYGRTRNAGRAGVYNVVFSYELEDAGVYAAKAAVRLVQALAENTVYSIEDDISALSRIANRQGLGPSTRAIVSEAEDRGIPCGRLDDRSTVMLGQGARQKIVCAAITSHTNSIAVDVAKDKAMTKEILEKACIPVPEGRLVYDAEELEMAIEALGYPLVIKPLDANHGRGITTNISDRHTAARAFEVAQVISEEVMVERFINGGDYRFLVINHHLVAVAKRVPAMVTGDGISSISKLVEQENNNPQRGEGHARNLTRIIIDDNTINILRRKGYTAEMVLKKDEVLYLKDTANISTGGTAEDVTDEVHPETRYMAERAARLLNLDICGLDIIAEDISKPLTKHNAAVLEVNACPGLRMHLSPTRGEARNVAAPIVDMLFPENAESRIPVVAVTGTNGKTTTTRLIAYMASMAGKRTGFCTSDGVYIEGHKICDGDCSGPSSAAIVLRDPAVDFAVLETARGGILRSGMGFDHCNISIVTNISADHLGMDGIDTLEQMARVKLVVPRSTFDHGHAILNADDDLVYTMAPELDCNIAFFSMRPDNERILKHRLNGGIACILEKGMIVLCEGMERQEVLSVEKIPLTFGGSAAFMIQNVLAAVLAGHLSGFSLQQVGRSLMSFIPSSQLTPGRMNLFRFGLFDILLDYAHNDGGYREIKTYLEKAKPAYKIGIIAATGDRRDEDIRMIGELSGQMFDEIIIRHDKNSRGRNNDELTDLLLEGIKRTRLAVPATVISEGHRALEHAVQAAAPGTLIFYAADKVAEDISFIEKMYENYQSGQTLNSKVA